MNVDGEIARLKSLENNLKEEEPEVEVKAEKNKSSDGAEKMAENESERSSEESKKRPPDSNIEDEATKKPKLSQDENATVGTSTSNDQQEVKDIQSILEEVGSKLSTLVGDEVAAKTTELITHWEKERTKIDNSTSPTPPPPKGVDDDKKYVTLPLVENKEDRKAIHMLIKSDLLKQFVAADTVDKKIRIWHIMFETQMPNYGKFVKDERFKNNENNKKKKNKKVEWPKDRPKFLRFVLYKENIDTGTAAKDIGRIIRLPPKGHRNNRGGSGQIGYAGMKDKRGVTSQFCTVYRKTPDELMTLNRDRGRDGNKHGGGNSSSKGKSIMRVGHFSYVNQDLQLG